MAITNIDGVLPAHEQARHQEFMASTGRFIQNFAILELTVAAWLLRLEETPERAVEFLTKTRQFDARARRLQSHFRNEGRDELTAALDEVEPHRLLRNDLAHGPIAITEGDPRMAIITWNGTRHLSVEELATATKGVSQIFDALIGAYSEKFGTRLTLERAAAAAPPPVE